MRTVGSQRINISSAEVENLEKFAIESAPHPENHSKAFPLLDVDFY
jgi:hypothetical protein